MSFDYSLIDKVIQKANDLKEDELVIEKTQEAYDLLEEYCNENPFDYEAKISLAIFLGSHPFYYEVGGIEILNTILIVDEYYAKVLTARAKLETFMVIADDTFEMIEEYLSQNDETAPYYGEMLMNKAFYLRTYDKNEKLETTLLKSIEVSPDFAWNYMLLGDLLYKQGNKSEAHKYYEKALENTMLVDGYCPPYDLEILLDELLRGIKQWPPNYESLKKKCEMTKPDDTNNTAHTRKRR